MIEQSRPAKKKIHAPITHQTLSRQGAILQALWSGTTGGAGARRTPKLSDHSVAQARVFPGHQFLGQLVTAFVDVFGCSGKKMIDPGLGGFAEIIRDGQNFVRRFTVIDFVLRK